MSCVIPNACVANIFVYVVSSGLRQILHFGLAITLFVTCPESSIEVPFEKNGPTQVILPGVSVPEPELCAEAKIGIASNDERLITSIAILLRV